MKYQLIQLTKFNKAFGCYENTEPTAYLPTEVLRLRHQLIDEEFREYMYHSLKIDDISIIDIADALADLLYVVYGTILAHGLQDYMEEIFSEVHRSNMSKLENGKVIKRDDGKILKGSKFSPPDLEKILNRVEK